MRQVIEACHQHKRDYSPHTWTNGIGFYVNWNLVLSDRGNNHPVEYPLEEPSWIPEFREGIIEPIIPDKNAMLQPFKRPGLGFEINKKLLKKYGKRFYRMTDKGLAFKVIREKGLKTALAVLFKQLLVYLESQATVNSTTWRDIGSMMPSPELRYPGRLFQRVLDGVIVAPVGKHQRIPS